MTHASASLPYLSHIDAWLRGPDSWSLAAEYPRVFGAASKAQSLCLVSDAGLLAHAAVLDLVHRDAGAATRIRCVGSVVVDPGQRGMGLGRRLLEAVVDDFEASDCEVLLLWSQRRRFYAHFGFETWGSELWVRPDPSLPQQRIRPMREADLAHVARIHDCKPSRVDREAIDFAAALRIPRLDAWVLDADGAVAAYALVGKGMDFPGVVHDSGGENEALVELLRALPMHFAILPYHRLDEATRIGAASLHTIGLARCKHARAPRRGWSIEGLDSI